MPLTKILTELVEESCCGTSKFVKSTAKILLTLDHEYRVEVLERFTEAPDTQISEYWRGRIMEALDATSREDT